MKKIVFVMLLLAVMPAVAKKKVTTPEPQVPQSTDNMLTEQEQREGWKLLWDGKTTEEAMKDKVPQVPKSPSNHYVNFLRACQGIEKTRSPFQIAGVLCQVFCLGVIAQRLNTQLFFDPRTKRFTNNEFANAMLSGMPPRRGWEDFYKID